MGDCKKALVDSNGDMEEAIEILRKKGAASAAKRSERSAKEGVIIAKSSEDGHNAAIVEVNSETDFVARNQEFVNYADLLADAILNNEVKSEEELMKVSVGDDSIQGLHNEILAKFSENIQIRRFERFTTDGYFTDYVHAGNQLAVLLEVSESDLTDNAKTMIRDIAMQVAAMNPSFVTPDEVPDDVKEKEKALYRQQAIDEGKKEDIADRIAEGKLNKFYQEECLVKQAFVKDPKKNVSDILKEISDEIGKDLKIVRFRRYYLGEED